MTTCVVSQARLLFLLIVWGSGASLALVQRRPSRERRPSARYASSSSASDSKDRPGPRTATATANTIPSSISRRDCLVSTANNLFLVGTASTATLTTMPGDAAAAYQPAVRPTAYRVDSTIPPTLLPLASERQKQQVLIDLGKGSGTDKEAIVMDTLNLNNILNKAVFGTINAVADLTNPQETDKSGPGFATFVCLGLPNDVHDRDVALATQLLSSVVQPRRQKNAALPTALGLAGVPYSGQAALQAYAAAEGSDTAWETLVSSLTKEEVGVDEASITQLRPLLEGAKSMGLDLLALAPETKDAETARQQGLQFVDAERRSSYVIDPDGFIALTQDPRYKVYTDRSLLKDFVPRNDKETSSGNFYAQRILAHEAAATAVARYASDRPDALVAIVAPVSDVRFLNGINGRIPRVFAKLRPNDSKVTDNSVTTILLNPTARDTLSRSNYLRLEIGTSPEALDYQSKVADYLFFSSSPKVNLIPRLMNG